MITRQVKFANAAWNSAAAANNHQEFIVSQVVAQSTIALVQLRGGGVNAGQCFLEHVAIDAWVSSELNQRCALPVQLLEQITF